MTQLKPTTIDEYIATFPSDVQAILRRIRATIAKAIPKAQEKIITATKEGTAPDAALVAQAGLRSRHNTFMSVPLVFTMISNHYPTMYGNTYRDICLLGVIVIGPVSGTSWNVAISTVTSSLEPYAEWIMFPGSTNDVPAGYGR